MVELKNVKKIYRTESRDVIAVNNVSLALPNIGLICIHGKSGSGKTTLLNIISGIDNFQEGDIIVDDFSYSHATESDMDDFRNTHIGMISQYFNLFEHMSVFENIEFPLNIQKKFCENASHDYSNKLLSYVGLNGLGDVKINELSGGQKQRVAIARAIIKSPQIILADEPTGNLDTQTGSQIMELLKKISNNKLVVVVSHDEELCSRYADMIIRIADGEIKEIGNNCIRNSEEIINRVDDRDFFTQKRRLPKKLSFRNTFRFSLHLMTNKAIRLSFTLIVCVLTLLLMELFIYISDYNSSTVITQYLREYPQNGITFYKQASYEDSFFKEHSKKVFGGKFFYNLLNKNYNSEDLIGVTTKLPIRSADNNRVGREINCIFSTPIYENRYVLSVGRYTQAANEVLITDYLAKQLFLSNEEAVNNLLYIGNMMVKIVGIVKTDYRMYGLESKLEMQQDVEYTLHHYNKEYNIMLLNEGFLDEYKTVNDYLLINYSNFFYSDREITYFLDSSGLSYGEVDQNAEIEIVAGRTPQHSNEALVSKDLYTIYMNKQSGINTGTSENEKSDFNAKAYSFIDIYAQKYDGYYFDSLNLFDYFNEITIVGVFEYKNEHKGLECDVLLTEDVHNKLSADYYDLYFHTYYILNNENYSIDKIVAFCGDNNVLIDEPSISQIYNFQNTIQSFINVLKTVAIILVIIALFMLLSYVSNSISSNTRTIGILRSLGVRKRDTLNIFVVEAMFISLLSLVLSMVGLVAFAAYGNIEFSKTLVENPFNIIVINIPHLIVISSLTVLFTLSALSIPIMLLARKTPMQIINNQK